MLIENININFSLKSGICQHFITFSLTLYYQGMHSYVLPGSVLAIKNTVGLADFFNFFFDLP